MFGEKRLLLILFMRLSENNELFLLGVVGLILLILLIPNKLLFLFLISFNPITVLRVLSSKAVKYLYYYSKYYFYNY